MRIILLAGLLCMVTAIYSQTEGTLSVKVTTKGTGIKGMTFAPKHCTAIWIQDEKGNFIKTLFLNAMARRTHLNAWEEASKSSGAAFNTVDAITGPTANTHGLRTCTWDGTNYKGEKMPDGKYLVFMELTDLNESGRVSSVTFEKGPGQKTVNAPDQQSFTGISVSWTPKI